MIGPSHARKLWVDWTAPLFYKHGHPSRAPEPPTRHLPSLLVASLSITRWTHCDRAPPKLR